MYTLTSKYWYTLKIENMKTFLILSTLLFFCGSSFGQNQNISNGNIFDGEPYLSINPENPKHMVVAWMGYLPLTNVLIKTRVTFNGGANLEQHKLNCTCKTSLRFCRPVNRI